MVLKMLPKDGRAIVSGVNLVRKHNKPSASGPGGIENKEASIHLSNLAVEDPRTGKPARVGVRVLEDGRRVRFAKGSGEVIDV